LNLSAPTILKLTFALLTLVNATLEVKVKG
jgi:hypothetical protein